MSRNGVCLGISSDNYVAPREGRVSRNVISNIVVRDNHGRAPRGEYSGALKAPVRHLGNQ